MPSPRFRRRGACGDAELSADVPATQWKALRLHNLPQNVSLAVRVETSGPIRIILTRRTPSSLPEGPARHVQRHRGAAPHLRVTIAVAGDYYVILDNRKGDAAREVKVFVQVLRTRPPQKSGACAGPAGLDAI